MNLKGDAAETTVTPERWCDHACFFVFDPTPGLTSNQLELVPEGANRMSTWSVRGVFNEAPKKNLVAFIVREIDRVLQIDESFVANVV